MGLFGRFARSRPGDDDDQKDATDADGADKGSDVSATDKDAKSTDGSGAHTGAGPQGTGAPENGSSAQPQTAGPGGAADGDSAALPGDAKGANTGTAAGVTILPADDGTPAAGGSGTDGGPGGGSNGGTGGDKINADAGAGNAAGHAQDAGDSDVNVQQQRLELDDIQQRIKNVKGEYGESVRRLMDTKKDLNEKRLEIETAEKKLAKIQDSVDAAAEIDAQARKKIDAQKAELEKLKNETKEAQESYDALLEGISQEQHALSALRTQHSAVSQQLEETNARLYNAREELDRQDTFQGPGSLTRGEREFIEGGDASGLTQQQTTDPGSDADAAGMSGPRSYAGVVEAASVVVASLKSKLGMTQKELEAAQRMLDQERVQHAETRRQLDSALSQQQKTQPPQDADTP